MDENYMTLLIYSAKMGIYKIIGGEMIAWEDNIEVAKRESTQEIGCETEILWEIWEIIEQRPADSESGRGNIQQSSYCYYGKILWNWELQMSEAKKDRGFEFVWTKVWDVLDLMNQSQPKTIKAELVKNRDIAIFREYLKLWNS